MRKFFDFIKKCFAKIKPASPKIAKWFVVRKKDKVTVLSKSFRGADKLLATKVSLFAVKLSLKGFAVLWICDTEEDAHILVVREKRLQNERN